MVYETLATLGEGSYGRVYIANDNRTGETVALKAIERYHNEGYEEANLLQSLMKLNCTHIVRCFGSFESNISQRLNIVLEYMPGGSLDYVLEHERPALNDHESRNVMAQVACALSHMHAAHVLHRDVKPSSVLLAQRINHSASLASVRVKLSDLSVSKQLERNCGMASTMIGSPLFLAPDLLQGHSYGFATDIWSAGAMLHQMATGMLPFNGRNQGEVFLAILQNDRTNASLQQLSPDIRGTLEACLQPDPSNRLSADSLAHAFGVSVTCNSGTKTRQRKQWSSSCAFVPQEASVYTPHHRLYQQRAVKPPDANLKHLATEGRKHHRHEINSPSFSSSSARWPNPQNTHLRHRQSMTRRGGGAFHFSLQKRPSTSAGSIDRSQTPRLVGGGSKHFPKNDWLPLHSLGDNKEACTASKVEGAETSLDTSLAFAFGESSPLPVTWALRDDNIEGSGKRDKMESKEHDEEAQIRRVMQALQNASNSTMLRENLNDIVAHQKYDILLQAVKSLNAFPG